jgi:general secretion pathway protein D
VVAAHDLPDAEVMLEVEVLEVARDRLLNLGIKWPDNVVIATPPSANTIGAMADLTTRDLLITPLAVGFNFKLEDTDANLLASPRIRTRNKEKARIMIGDKVPVITNTTTPLATGASVVTGSVQYLDVGIRLEVEPQIYAEGDVGIKLFLDVSNIVKEIPGPNGSLAYQIGTRSAQTNLRLRDGETQILGGLISELDRRTASKVPGLGQLPVLGKLFSNTNSNTIKTEIILSITPRIVRSVATADASLRDIYSGTEASMRFAPLRLDPVGSAGAAPIVVGAPAMEGAGPLPQSSNRSPATARGGARAPSAAPAEPVSAGNSEASAPASTEPSSPPPTDGTSEPERPAAPAPTSLAPPAPDQTAAAVTAPASAPAAGTAATAATTATAAFTAAAPAELRITGPTSVRVGEEFDVTIDASIAAPVRNLPLLVRFDPKVLLFVGAVPEELAQNTSIDGISGPPEPTVGRLEMELRAASKPLSGQGKLLKLRFSARTVRAQTIIAVGSNSAAAADGLRVPAQNPSLRVRVGP